ncbi:MAG: efflux RND transporter periplasmic adaptor subunit [Bryobacteraceae bacterium]|nr:efflux RND transporter periplasmic adaptor subunit [Bryobacteraceae bacterium]
MRRSVFSVLCLLVSIACSGPYSAKKVAAKEERAIPVQVVRVAPQSIPEVVTATGELFAEEVATISAKVPGRVTKLLVDLGSQVEAGQVIAELETDDYDFRVRQSEALVEQTRARLGIAGKPTDDVVPEETAMVRQAAAARKEGTLIFATAQKLWNEGVISRIDLEKAGVASDASEARYQSAIEEVAQLRAQLAERRAQLSLARQQLSDAVLRAPFQGAVTRRIASQGEYLPVNSPVATIVRQHPLRIRLEVPERMAIKVRIGQRVDVKLEGRDATRAGRVVRMSPALEAANRSLLVEGEIPNQDGVLRPGSFVEGAITVNPNAQGIAAPLGALLSFAGIERMFVVKDGVLEERLVKTGRRFAEDRVEVLEGLQAGDQLVKNATDRMTKGAKAAPSQE